MYFWYVFAEFTTHTHKPKGRDRRARRSERRVKKIRQIKGIIKMNAPFLFHQNLSPKIRYYYSIYLWATRSVQHCVYIRIYRPALYLDKRKNHFNHTIEFYWTSTWYSALLLFSVFFPVFPFTPFERRANTTLGNTQLFGKLIKKKLLKTFTFHVRSQNKNGERMAKRASDKFTMWWEERTYHRKCVNLFSMNGQWHSRELFLQMDVASCRTAPFPYYSMCFALTETIHSEIAIKFDRQTKNARVERGRERKGIHKNKVHSQECGRECVCNPFQRIAKWKWIANKRLCHEHGTDCQTHAQLLAAFTLRTTEITYTCVNKCARRLGHKTITQCT